MPAQIGDQRIRKGQTNIIAQAKSALGTFSQGAKNIQWANRHFVTFVPNGTITAGVVSVRAAPRFEVNPGALGYAPVGIENINLATATSWQFTLDGFFTAFAFIIGTAVTGGGTITCVVNSTIMD